ncbi:ATP-binding cassette domain-containing protein [Shouchella sp. JSM 1781072]|uniref:ATP-binding cassette domain-containing protein n=1 Tax=Bacillaceae TaxID=186817 RepID=UPI000C0838BE|nr:MULTISPECIES: ATP-binding cassette domain-containing protein [Bacillaceae]UTR06638.1 ATP-binding cassette domain-containing protein [Alkalihalobacillus sp. LMS6]
MLAIKDVSFSYNSEDPLIKHVSLTLYEGERVAIIGKSGSGKSTLGKLIKGLLTPTEGSIEFSNNLRGADIGFLFQNPDNQMVRPIVEDDLAFGLENQSVQASEISKRIDTYGKKLDIHHLRTRPINELSGGQKQRVALAGILILEPKWLILDEATAMIDPEGRKEILQYMDQLQHEGTSIVTITHDAEEVAKCTRIIGLVDGEIGFDGSLLPLLDDPKIMEELGLDAPFLYTLINDLNANGIHVNKNAITSDEELCDALWRFALKT